MSAIRDSANVLLTVVAWSDCIRCICIPRRRTLFAFSNLPGEPAHNSSSSAVVDDVTSQPYDVNAHQGLPVGLMLCVAATANLACEMDALPDEVVRVKAQGIENAVREWKPPPPDAQDLADSAGYVEKVSTSEMWRHVRPSSWTLTEREKVLTLAPTGRHCLFVPSRPPPWTALEADPRRRAADPPDRSPHAEPPQSASSSSRVVVVIVLEGGVSPRRRAERHEPRRISASVALGRIRRLLVRPGDSSRSVVPRRYVRHPLGRPRSLSEGSRGVRETTRVPRQRHGA